MLIAISIIGTNPVYISNKSLNLPYCIRKGRIKMRICRVFFFGMFHNHHLRQNVHFISIMKDISFCSVGQF